ncbi:MAG TPA: rhodanese-like domain-containing protein [Nitrospirota bacterium]
MKKGYVTYFITAMTLVLAIPAYAVISADTVEEISNVLISAPAASHWQVKADDVYGWMQAKKTDFVIVDVRTEPPGQKGGKMPGAIYIPYNEILKAENLKRLPKDKKLVLVCVTGQTQNLPMLVLRTMGYDAYTMAFGHAAWINGYLGANFMQDAIKNAGEKNFPVEK